MEYEDPTKKLTLAEIERSAAWHRSGHRLRICKFESCISAAHFPSSAGNV